MNYIGFINSGIEIHAHEITVDTLQVNLNNSPFKLPITLAEIVDEVNFDNSCFKPKLMLNSNNSKFRRNIDADS